MPLLCLHGWLDNAASFAPLSQQLPEYRIIALDLPGHGHSEHRPRGVTYHQLDWIVDTVEAAEQLGLAECALVGHSMGAGIAALAAGTFPELVSRLVLLEGLGWPPAAPEEAPARLRKHYEARQQARRYPVLSRGAPLDTALRARLTLSHPIEREAARLLVQRGVRSAAGGVTFRTDRRLHEPGPGQLSEPQLLAFFRRIACRTLLVLGDRGLRLQSETMTARARAVDQLEVVTVQGGHHVHMENPAVVAAHVRRFLAG